MHSFDAERVASTLTALFDPPLVVAALLLLVSGRSGLFGLFWGTAAAIGVAFLPALYVLYGVDRHQFRDYTLPTRQNRPPVFLLTALSGALTLAVLNALHGPPDILAVLGTVVAGLVGAAVVSLFWKISIHLAALSAAITILTVVYGPLPMLLSPFLVLVAWARHRLGAHTPAQIVAGAVVGTLGASSVFLVLRAMFAA